MGDRADDVELHLVGSRTTETSERVRESLAKDERKAKRAGPG